VSVAKNLASVRERISRAGRDPDEVSIVAVTKGFGAEVCQEALGSGLTILGENRVQEALGKMAAVRGAQWHLIGHLQTNKVRQAAGRFALIQSVDSLHLAERLAQIDARQAVLVEVNVAREPQKSGVHPDRALALLDEVSKRLDLQGLMAMGPTQGDPTQAFRELTRLRAEAQQRLGRSLPILSMGMSGDFEIAVQCGATMVRLGQVLFGPRQKAG
jgi:hypothetical protein